MLYNEELDYDVKSYYQAQEDFETSLRIELEKKVTTPFEILEFGFNKDNLFYFKISADDILCEAEIEWITDLWNTKLQNTRAFKNCVHYTFRGIY